MIPRIAETLQHDKAQFELWFERVGWKLARKDVARRIYEEQRNPTDGS